MIQMIPIFSTEYCNQITKKLVAERDNPEYFYRDIQVPDALTIHPHMFPSITKKYESIRPPTNLKLKPTNWYGRMYLKGNELKRHYDGVHCDHSMTITIGYSHENWPIFISGDAYDIPIGYGAYYRGCFMEHWREPLETDWHIQFFFHYVLDEEFTRKPSESFYA